MKERLTTDQKVPGLNPGGSADIVFFILFENGNIFKYF